MNEKDFPVSSWWALIGPVGRKKYSREGQPPLYTLIALLVMWLLFSGLVSFEFISAHIAVGNILMISSILLGVMVLLGLFLVLPGIITNILRRKNFHFSLDGQVLTVQDGIISKEQRQFPYSVIQDVQISQNFAHRLFGLACVTVENAAKPGSNISVGGIAAGVLLGVAAKPSIGISDNQVIIPALRKQDAENLKATILQKMQVNSSVDTGSGL
jgi:uncharacterized membrane protein YdbT with pleckstrin-like domain